MEALSKARKALALAGAALVMVIVPATAPAATFFVRGSVAASGDCLSDATACKTIGDAITKERGTLNEVDVIRVAPGTYPEALLINQAQDTGLTIEGAGSGADPALATIVRPASGVAFTLGPSNANTTLRRLRVTVPVGNTSRGISGNGTAMTLEDVAVEMLEPTSTATAAYVSQASSTLDHLSVGGTWAGPALDAAGNVTLRDSTLTGGGTNAPVMNLGGTPTAHLTTILRSRLQQTAGNNLPVINASDPDILLDSSLLLGSSTVVSETNNTGATRTITVVSSTLDAGTLGSRDGGSVTTVLGNASGAGARTDVAVRGSILLEPVKSGTGGGASASATCRDSDAPDQTQAPDATHGAIDCANAAGNATSAPSDLFAAPGTDYNLKSASSAVDAVAEPAAAGAVSGADLAGNPRVLDGNFDCIAVRDRGALELTGRANTPPAVAVSAPVKAFIGALVPFGGSATDQDPASALTFAWRFSDGAGAAGAAAPHAFAAKGNGGATLTVTDSHGCAGAAARQVAVAGIGLTKVSMLHKKFRVAGARGAAKKKRRAPAGTAFRYTLTEAATMTITIQRKVKRRFGKAKTLTARAKRGRNSTRFTGRIRKRALPPGSYRAKLKTRDRARNVSSTRTVSFTIVR